MIDVLWNSVRSQAQQDVKEDPALAEFLQDAILSCTTLEEAVALQLARKLADPYHFSHDSLMQLITATVTGDDVFGYCVRQDIVAFVSRDPACTRYYSPLLFFKGFLSIQAYRVAHRLWLAGRRMMALYLQNRIAEVFGVDIHPAARLGSGILLDHATGVVIGETAMVEDNVSILHSVTLGGTGKSHGDRHPKVRTGVLIGAGAKILGNIEIGAGAKVGAGSVVLRSVPPSRTAVGNPATLKETTGSNQPALDMEHGH